MWRITIIHITMTDVSTYLTLQTWMSAAFPTGAFTSSHGLEAAIADHRIHDAMSCQHWISSIIRYGSGWNDAVLTANAYALLAEPGNAAQHASQSTYLPENSDAANDSESSFRSSHPKHTPYSLRESLTHLNDLALALCAGAERLRETTQLGSAFFKAAAAWLPDEPASTRWVDGDISLPVAVGISGALAAIPVQQLLPASLQASSSNLVWISTRLVPLGQNQALKIIAELSSVIESTAERALHSTLEDLGSGALLGDLSSIEHEQLHSRICIT